ncbi:MAG: hypothetical protein JXB30_20065 [Anaerolineae bacterium]|nr:hypothetical protein [Anaerolineae bacterium]
MPNRRSVKRKILLAVPFVVLVAVFALGGVLFSTTLQRYHQQAQTAEIFDGLSSTHGYGRAFATETQSLSLLSRGSSKVPFSLWSRGLTGEFSLAVQDETGTVVYEWQGRDIELSEALNLERGSYILELAFRYYSGSLRFGFSEVKLVSTLAEDRYRYIEAETDAGFDWDYILYLPEDTPEPTLLVIPNNTGYAEDDIVFHTEAAKGLVQSMSSLADALGTPLLVPVFPRPAGEPEEYYTHNLDRDVLLMDVEGYERLDLQLLAMVADARDRLAAEQVFIDEQFLMWGFSASGTFADRFSLLHPERLKAVAAGGCLHSLPFSEHNGENLPYPIGTYDYELITGEPFDLQDFSSLPRFLFKGDADSGGTVTTDAVVYPADEYFNLFVRSEVEAASEALQTPLVDAFEMTHRQEDIIKYRIYDGAVFVDEFAVVSQIFSQANLDKSRFKLYEGVGHEYTNEMKEDVLAFFLEALY